MGDAGDEDELLAQVAEGDMRALEALYRWLEAHGEAVHTTWPKEMLEGIEAKLAAAEADAEDAGD